LNFGDKSLTKVNKISNSIEFMILKRYIKEKFLSDHVRRILRMENPELIIY
jgi:hypothetical protein